MKPCKTSSGVMPMDGALMTALESYEVSFVLMHAPSKATPAQKRPNKRPKLMPPAEAAPIKGKGKAKVSGKGKGALAWAAAPKQIRDLQGSANTPTGDPIWFSYNLSVQQPELSQETCVRPMLWRPSHCVAQRVTILYALSGRRCQYFVGRCPSYQPTRQLQPQRKPGRLCASSSPPRILVPV